MVTLYLVCEVQKATSKEYARAKLDAMREAVLPGANYGITLYEVPHRSRAERIAALSALYPKLSVESLEVVDAVALSREHQ